MYLQFLIISFIMEMVFAGNCRKFILGVEQNLEINVQQMIFEFLGGLGIFLYGIKQMGDGLQRSAGDKLRDLLDRFTTNPFMGVLTGIVVTGLIQSSSATTVIVVGLVSAGFMTLRQAIGVIMGANIGTTMTAFLIGIDLGEYALPILAFGTLLIFFFKNKKVQNTGQIFFGFGALFFGLELMSSGMSPLRELDTFHELTVTLSSNPILGVVVGTVFTVIVQSSSATIGVLQGLYGEGLVDLGAALPVLFGDNIGTTITAILASIGASVAARRAAATHVLFNLLGTTIFLLLIQPFTLFIGWLQTTLSLNPQMTIAFAHGAFNITNTIIQFPFIAVLAWIVTKIIPGDDVLFDFKPKHLDPVFIQRSASIALGQAKEEVVRMGQFAIMGLNETYNFLKSRNAKHADHAYQIEDAINNLDQKITDYLVTLSSRPLTDAESKEHSMLVNTIRDLERIGDHFENIIELVEYQQVNKVKLSIQAMDELEEIFNLTISTVEDAVKSLDNRDRVMAVNVLDKEEQIDKLERKLRKQHIARLNSGICTGQAGIVFADIVSNLERIGDHSVNIAQAVLGERD